MSQKSSEITTNPIPLVRAAFAEPFRIAMRRNAINADSYLAHNGLPRGTLTDANTLVPEKPFWNLANQVAIAERIPDFGAQVARIKPWFHIETLNPTLAAQSDLGAMLHAFCKLSGVQSNAAAFELHINCDECLFESVAKPLLSHDVQMELYRVISMIDLVRACVGLEWQPNRINLRMSDNPTTQRIEGLRGNPIVFANARTGIKIPVKLLATPLDRNSESSGCPKIEGMPGQLPEGDDALVQAVRIVLALYLTDAKLSIELIADLADLSPRSLQRMLRGAGTSYRDLLNEARHNYAEKRLRDSNDSIAEIAHQLGYQEPGHFTRAFRRWHGCSPVTYRKSI